MYKKNELTHKKIIILCSMSIVLGAFATVITKLLLLSILFFTNLFWFHQFSFEKVELVDHHFSPVYILVPVLGGLIVGIMARFGSQAIRGHGIPEVISWLKNIEKRNSCSKDYYTV